MSGKKISRTKRARLSNPFGSGVVSTITTPLGDDYTSSGWVPDQHDGVTVSDQDTVFQVSVGLLECDMIVPRDPAQSVGDEGNVCDHTPAANMKEPIGPAKSQAALYTKLDIPSASWYQKKKEGKIVVNKLPSGKCTATFDNDDDHAVHLALWTSDS